MDANEVQKQGERSWWANCAWCGFGLAAMLLPSEIPVTVSVRSGSIGKELVFEVSDAGIHLQGGGQTGKCVVHYSAPPSSWWIDVKFACGTIHVFEDKDEAATWVSQYPGELGRLDPLAYTKSSVTGTDLMSGRP